MLARPTERVVLEFEPAWQALHTLARAGLDHDRKLMIALADRCIETAPRRSLRAASEGWRKAYARGSRVKFKSFPVTVIEPVNDELVDEVESAFEQGDQP